MTIRELQYQNPSRRLNESLLKWTLHNVLQALSFLHDEAKVVHTGKPSRAYSPQIRLHEIIDINPSNIMLTIDDASILDDFGASRSGEPLAQ
jgi:serine/threonine protein kinase